MGFAVKKFRHLKRGRKRKGKTKQDVDVDIEELDGRKRNLQPDQNDNERGVKREKRKSEM